MTFTTVLRRTHMYLALFLTPWMMVYALSTMAMNHHGFFKEYYGGTRVPFEKERELTYTGTFSDDATSQTVALQILSDLEMDGTHRVQGNMENGRITITRQHATVLRRIIYTPEHQKLVIERQAFRTPNWLTRMHVRRGYRHDYALEDAWAFSVDLTIVAMLFWAVSGLWIWWELIVTHRWGAVCLVGGIGLFSLFLFTI